MIPHSPHFVLGLSQVPCVTAQDLAVWSSASHPHNMTLAQQHSAGGKPYSRVRERKCHLCPRSFTKTEHLERHIRSHTKEKPYRCSECGKKYGRQ